MTILNTRPRPPVQRTRLRVRFNEVDTYAIVWHGHYVAYFEEGREDFGRRFGLSYTDFEAQNVVVPITAIDVKYRRPLLYGDEITIITEYVSRAAAKVCFKYRITDRSERITYCTGTSEQVMLDKQTRQLLPTNPEWYAEWKAQFAVWQP